MTEDWIATAKTKAEAAAFVGISEKAVERAAARKQIREGWRKDGPRKPCRVYPLEDLQKLKASIPRQVNGHVVTTNKAGGLVAEAMGKGGPVFQMQLMPARKPGLLLNLQEAIDYTGLTEVCIVAHARAGDIGFKDGGWKFTRAELRALVDHLTASRQNVRTAGQ